MEGNDIGSEGATALADELKSYTNLQTQNINENFIGYEGAAHRLMYSSLGRTYKH